MSSTPIQEFPDSGENLSIQDSFAPVCTSDTDVRCFIKTINPRRDGLTFQNTKAQVDSYDRYCKQECGRARRLNLIYKLAPDQNSDDCKTAIEFPRR